MNNLSIVIPVFNEQDNVIKLAQEIDRAFRNATYSWEVIWVDDDSEDFTVDILNSHVTKKLNHKILRMPSRSGQSASVLNGINHSKHDLIATLDGDGQNSPYDLISLKIVLEETDYLLIQGVRVERHDSNMRLFSTGLANGFRRTVLGDEFNDVGCAVRIFRKEIVKGLPAFKGWHRFLPVMISYLHPGKVLEYPVSHRERIAGKSKYGVLNRLWVGLFDLIGMLWFKKRMIKIYTSGEMDWKSTSMPSALQDKSFSQAGFLFNGLPANEQMNQ